MSELNRAQIKNINVRKTKEVVNINKLQLILNNTDYFQSHMMPETFQGDYAFSWAILRKYNDKLNRKGVIDVKYKQIDSSGRIYAVEGLSLGAMPRLIRGALANGLYIDIDIENCHPVILLHLCGKLNIVAPELTRYINNRNLCIDELINANSLCDRAYIKKVILAVMNGGSADYNAINPTEWIVRFREEIKGIQTTLAREFDTLYSQIKNKRIKEGRDYNHDAGLMAHLINREEYKYLSCIIEYLKDTGRIGDIYVPIHDGLMIPDTKLSTEELNRLLDAISEHVYNVHGIHFILKHKEFETFSDDVFARVAPPDPEDIAIMPTDNPLYFDFNDKYFWIDFINALCADIWPNLDTLLNYAKININRVMIVLSTGEIYVKRDGDEPFYYLNKWVECNIRYGICINGDNICKKISLKALYVKHLANMVRFYNNLVLLPKDPAEEVAEQNGRDFNTWSGFISKLLPEHEVDYSKIQKIMDHLRVVWANGDDEHFHYICSWFHSIFKRPYQKTRVALVFYGQKQQGGKSMVIENFIIPFIFGNKLSCVENGLNFANERFNSRLMNKLFICSEEVNAIDARSNIHSTFDTMKKLLTNKTISIEIKGGAKFEIADFSNYILFTNNELCLKLEQSDARYYVGQCSDVYVGRFDYFNELAASFNQDAANHFFSYLYHLQNPVDVRKIPMTKLKREIQLHSLPTPLRFLHRVKEIIDAGEVKEDDEVLEGWASHIYDLLPECTGSDLYGLYRTYCRDEGEAEKSNTLFGRMINGKIEKRRNMVGLVYNLRNITM